MENKKSSVIKSITGSKPANFALKISVVVLFLTLLSAVRVTAQTTVPPYPDVDNGEELFISPGEECYDIVMDQATITRTTAQDDINTSYPDDPEATDYWSCSGNVCCHTYAYMINGVACYFTDCTVNGVAIDTIVMH